MTSPIGHTNESMQALVDNDAKVEATGAEQRSTHAVRAFGTH